MPSPLKERVLSGLLWRGLERVGTQGIQFVIAIVIARQLMPKDFGTVALISVFIALAAVFVESGFGAALIQKRDATDLDFCSIFYFNLGGASLLYGVLFFGAPWVSTFYHDPILTPVIRVLALALILQAFGKIQSTLLTRDMKFKLSMKVSLAASLIAGTIGVGMAYSGFGLWSLVFSSLGSAGATSVLLWFVVGWRPHLRFSLRSIRSLFRYSSKLLASGLLDTAFNNLHTAVIGKFFSPVALGFYNRGQSFPSFLVNSISGTISGVMFPALAGCQDDIGSVKRILRRMLKTTTFLVFPALLGLAVIADPLVVLVLTEKWLPCSPFLQVSCVTFAFWPIHVANLQVIKALGRSDIFLTLEVMKKALVVAAILVTLPYGLMAMVVGQAATSFMSIAINARPNSRLIDYSIREQLTDILPNLLAALSMAVLTYALGLLVKPLLLRLVVQILVGVASYVVLCHLLRLESYRFLLQTAMDRISPHVAS